MAGRLKTLSRGTCRSCGLAVDRALDGDRAALAWTVDPRRLDAVGELLAVAAGLATFELLNSETELCRRGDSALRSGRRDRPIVAEHRCPVR